MAIQDKYSPKDFEEKLYNTWEKKGYFHGKDVSKKPSFSMILPPPNVTGALHMGHAVTDVIQDTIVRRKRMQGFNTVWLPGTDHAGIATQMVVERELMKKGISRHDLGREKFLEKVWEVKDRHHSIMINQMKKMGVSLDWERERFSLDDGFSNAVNTVFIKLHEKGLLYRGEKLISWCPRCSTALSDLEVDQKPKKGKLYYIKYFLEESKDYVVVATTRPETLLGDTAVAINPKDKRFKKYHGKKALVPFTGRSVPIILDNHVEIEFGTGCLKITPGHDFNDYEIGQKHSLKTITVIDKDGKMNENAASFKGLNVKEAREKIIKELEEKDLLEKIEDYDMMISGCSRCDTVVEPLTSKQWFVKMDGMAKKAIDVVKNGKIKFYPEGWWEKTYFNWLENIRDWCVSRQLWWGHRLPVWYCKDCEKYYVTDKSPEKCECGSKNIYQDSDVLDTWFSAALWPFVAFAWPEKTPQLKTFYPNSLMETGFDIIFFWVARMIMFGIEFMDEVPFKEVLYHAMVRDKKGQKMSKTKGNVIDPLDVIDKYGTDTLRFTLASMAGRSRDIKLSEKAMETNNFFMNKIWQASKFVFMSIKEKPNKVDLNNLKHDLNKWIISRLNSVILELNKKFEVYDLAEVSNLLYKFFWHEFCDWYIEFSKPLVNDKTYGEETRYVLAYVHLEILKLFHPIIPFITEEIFLNHPLKNSDTVMLELYPKEDKKLINKDVEENFNVLKNIISTIRQVKILYGINQKTEVKVLSTKFSNLINRFKSQIEKLASLSSVSVVSLKDIDIKGSIHNVLPDIDIYLQAKGVIDFDKEIKRLNKKQESVKKDLKIISGKLNNKKFIENAKKELIDKEKEKLNEAKKLDIELNEALKVLKECQM
jgi:valyl-tRNA synthetase